MSVRKQTVSFTDTAFAFAQGLVDAGEYPTVSAAVSGELARAKALRETQAALLEAEVQRRLALPPDRWEPLGDIAEITGDARARLAKRRAHQDDPSRSRT